MSRSVQKQNKETLLEIAVYCSILILLLLSSLSLSSFVKSKKVLGASTMEQEQKVYETKKFWSDFLNKNPDYIPGWIEIGRLDRVKEIDPNYF